ncbi:LysR family transcriptional regulator [Sandaracinobacter sp. RS1-74]|uniref:LysR family transcriptional regulator n=1 Tax=Sandaracinobacteroides sayramensis TaxID=2913411 RepID=UPI001EDB0896|nr:LysR family transcriptional regulator [Sandaracinobacteroides sayramensis]MCG2842281.1 LysR family transcriptional regulator [Sandaracinobacteroides sayramensis]
MAALVQTLAVAEYLSFHRAARALGTSQSSVSARVKALEEELGVLLFQRNTRGVRLTEAGRSFIAQVGGALETLDRAVKTAGMVARGEHGALRIGVHGLVAGGFLDRLLNRFRRLHVGVSLHITESTARDAQIQVREDQLDVAFIACTHEIPDLRSRVIWRDRLMVAMPETNGLARQDHIEWQHLAPETFLVRESGTGPQVHDLIVLRAAGKWPVPTISRCNVGRDSLLAMIAAGQGISLFTAENLGLVPSAIVAREIADEQEAVAFSAIWSPHNQSQTLRNMLDLAGRMQRESGS